MSAGSVLANAMVGGSPWLEENKKVVTIVAGVAIVAVLLIVVYFMFVKKAEGYADKTLYNGGAGMIGAQDNSDQGFGSQYATLPAVQRPREGYMGQAEGLAIGRLDISSCAGRKADNVDLDQYQQSAVKQEQYTRHALEGMSAQSPDDLLASKAYGHE